MIVGEKLFTTLKWFAIGKNFGKKSYWNRIVFRCRQKKNQE